MSDLTVLKNVFANLCRGGAVALTMLLIPPFLARILDKDTYGTWLLLLQLATYVSLFELGIQTVIGRCVAHYNALDDRKKRNSIISSAVALLTIVGWTTICGFSLLAAKLPQVFTDMPVALQSDAQLALLLLGWSIGMSLQFSAFGGVFIGLQRYDIPAWVIGSSRLLAGVLVVIAAYTTRSLTMMAVAVAICNVGSGVCQYFIYKRITNGYVVTPRLVTKASLKEVGQSCLAISVSSLGLLIVSGLDTSVIGRFDYSSIPYYALAATLCSFVVGISASILNTTIPLASTVGAQAEPRDLGDLLVKTTRYMVAIAIATNLPLVLLAKPLITIWVGADYATKTTYFFELLVIANFIRNVGSPYYTIAVGCGEHNKVILSPLLEAIANLIVSIVLTERIGATGVVLGTVVGGVVSVSMHLLYNLPRTKKIQVRDRWALVRAVFNPVVVVVVPIVAAHFAIGQFTHDLTITLTASTLLAASVWLLLWQYVLSPADRQLAAVALDRVLRRKQPIEKKI